VAGFFGAPLVSGLLWSLITLSPYGGFFALILAYPFAWVLGIPGYLLFRRFGWLKFWQVMSAGGFLGGISCTIFFYSFGPPAYLKAGDMLTFGIFIVHGVAVASMFWFIAIKPRKYDVG
jgi:hypothetical protein